MKKIKTAERNDNAQEKEEMTEDAKQNDKLNNANMGWGMGRRGNKYIYKMAWGGNSVC